MKARFEKYLLEFKRPSGTSRGVLRTKLTYFITVTDGLHSATGEAALFRGLSFDDRVDYEDTLQDVCNRIDHFVSNYQEELKAYPSIVFGLDQVFLKLQNQSSLCFENSFTAGEFGIPINGLIWMGDEGFMHNQIAAKLAQGFRCLKLKIGALDFKKEIGLLKSLRQKYTSDQLELRVDANGAFSPAEAMNKLEQLTSLDIHSIEQPIRAGQFDQMANLCKYSPLDIALDEELIGHSHREDKRRLLHQIRPAYIILKPALLGGFKSCDEWINLAEQLDIAWWITSALESNIGLEAIAQYTASKHTKMYQGLGTGQLFTNNVSSHLEIINAKLWFPKSGR